MAEKKVKLPLYMKEIYGWLYNNPRRSKLFDSQRFLQVLTLGNSRKLIESTLKEIRTSDRVLQVGATFGDQIEKTADKVGFYGQYDIVDVNPEQLERIKEKYKYVYPKTGFILQDAAQPFEEKYDVVLCYMLLHEVPNLTKTKIVNNIMKAVDNGGKLVFVDYHNPESWHPLRYFVRLFNRLYQPFAEKLWDREIHSWASKKSDFTWRKTTFFGRMYQKVVATKKDKFVTDEGNEVKVSPADRIWQERA